MTPDNETVLTAALEAQAAGLCVVPPKMDGSKAPFGAWNEFQTRRSTIEEIRAWFSNGRTGLGVVLGKPSANAELLEFDDKPTYKRFRQLAKAAGLGELLERIESGFVEASPNGVHWLYRCNEVEGNKKLALRPKADSEKTHANDNVKVLIETRGEGGFVIVAPSYGRVHPSGKPYRLLKGGFRTLATITPDERDALFELARSLDEMPKREAQVPVSLGNDPLFVDGERPGDYFNRTQTWASVLEPYGWVLNFTHGTESYWRRPGKERGQSATTNYAETDLLKVFSTSTPFDVDKTYSRFAAYTVLEYGGDFSAAAKAISATMPKVPRARAIVAHEEQRAGETIERIKERAIDGGAFVFDEADELHSLWGQDESVFWSRGESLLIVGPTGIGKTTIGQQVALGRIGLRDSVLGYPVTAGAKKCLYVAADRPRQARRSLARMVKLEDRPALSGRLTVWKGPLPFDVRADPAQLFEFASSYDADTLVLDSLKDVALELAKDETGSAVNMAIQICLAGGIEVLVLHHQRKGQAGAKPKTIEDVYGSVWITSGAGGVVLVWGEPGDPIVELTHLKQPAEPIGPLKVLHDHVSGTSAVVDTVDALALVNGASKGITARFLAMRMFERHDPTKGEVEKARRRLDALVRKGHIEVRSGAKGGAAGAGETVYLPIEVPGIEP